jgi:AcrR family transcriptional regulator
MFTESNDVHQPGTPPADSGAAFTPPPGEDRESQARSRGPGDAAAGGRRPAAGREERRGQRLRQTRDRILEAARDVMLETGPARLSLREVARRADFSPAALYKYFASRDEIIAELTAESFRWLRASLDDVPAELPADERLIQLGLAYMRFADENPADLRCILAVATAEPPTESDPPLVMGVEMARLLGETLREGVRDGLFRPLSQPELTRSAFACWSLVHGMAALAGINLDLIRDQVRRDPEGVLRDFVDSLRAGRDDQMRRAETPAPATRTDRQD